MFQPENYGWEGKLYAAKNNIKVFCFGGFLWHGKKKKELFGVKRTKPNIEPASTVGNHQGKERDKPHIQSGPQNSGGKDITKTKKWGGRGGCEGRTKHSSRQNRVPKKREKKAQLRKGCLTAFFLGKRKTKKTAADYSTWGLVQKGGEKREARGKGGCTREWRGGCVEPHVGKFWETTI